jgi:hypothetical protein
MSADIDIDFSDRSKILSIIQHVAASRLNQGELVTHNTGIYVQDIPKNPVTNLSTIDFNEADDRGYFKIDLLNVSVYKDVRDEEHLISLMNQEPLWDLLLQDDFVNMLFHLNGYGNVLRKMQPTSIEQLAAVLAMIRPAKKHLVGESWETVMKEVWVKPSSGEYYFKHSHAIAYAVAIVVQMNLICEKISLEYL